MDSRCVCDGQENERARELRTTSLDGFSPSVQLNCSRPSRGIIETGGRAKEATEGGRELPVVWGWEREGERERAVLLVVLSLWQ